MERTDADRLKAVLAKLMAVLTIIGAINWGLIGFFNWNLVEAILGGGSREATSALARLIYSVVGLAGVALALTFPWRQTMETTTTTTRITSPRSNRRSDVHA